jgi:hypothetical protein
MSEFKQISQLTDMKQGDARLPSQYNTSHFTFVSNENGLPIVMLVSSELKEQGLIHWYLSEAMYCATLL